MKALHVHTSPEEVETPCDEGNLEAAHEHCLLCEFVFTEVVPTASTDLPVIGMQVLVFDQSSYQAPFAQIISFQSLRAPPAA